ncbi:transcriptional regulator with XRE-family HTH domain [Chryseobacterium sp. SLBN-27]|uniref:helix-turn-helix domain-containing protein n=1 Tax=Chryseobacterium sp. SLBN-27 TaxID=3042287 RepID=UPI0028585FDF|nr:helix-turn-helix domain-containing protein [Chryseobacterium sp. SLBN-27]MDR6160179.1 transcriptional regulator with XRE-family HTH domain [Chryseobacterium sp. SLBN-27]
MAQKSGLSVRTIQRIEAGMQPKGYTLKTLAKSLDIPEKDLSAPEIDVPQETEIEELPLVTKEDKSPNLALVKIINLSSLPVAWFPVANFIVPLVIMLFTKNKSPIIKQIISLQIFLAIVSPVIFMMVALLKLGSRIVMITMILLVLVNIYIILRNAYEIDKKNSLRYKLNFSFL